MPELRESGIDVLGKIPWGSHFCNFYETKQDLLDTLVPYFKTGLESKEFCLWIVSSSGLITAEEAKEALEKVVPKLDQHLSFKGIEILNETDWYLEDGVFSLEKVISAWDVKLNRALALGYEGMRVSGDTFWINEKIWNDFVDYEKKLNDSVTDLPVTLLCTYPLEKSGGADILDVVQTHQFAIARRQGEWEVIESPELVQAKTEIKELNEELERRVAERTQELIITNDELRNEITERRHAEALLHAKEEEFRAIVENTPDYIARYNREFRRIYANPALARAYDLPVKDLIGKPMFSIILDTGLDIKDDELGWIRQRFAAVFDKGESQEFEITLPMPWGRRYYNVRLFPEFDVNGSVINILSISRDNTERRSAEEALKKEKEILAKVFDNIPVMIGFIGDDGAVKLVNPEWERAMGWTLKELQEQNVDIFAEAYPDLSYRQEIFDFVAASTGEWADLKIKVRDGRVIEAACAVVRLSDGTKIAIAQDITERKHAEDALRRSEAHLAEAQHLAKLGSWDFDILADRLTWSEELYNIFGTDKRTFKETHGSFLHLVDEEEKEFVLETNRHIQQTGEPFTIEYRINTAKGEKRVIQEHGYGQTDVNGRVVRLFGTSQDITERKKADETLKQSYEEIRRLTEHLQKIREEERTHIAREIHDELGQQLTALTMGVKGLNKKLNDPDERIKQEIGEIISLLDTMVKSVRRISSELRPGLLHNLGLVAAVEWHLKEFEKRSGIKTIFNEPKEELELPDSLKNGLFRIFQESLTNVSRHANANKIIVTLKQKGKQLILSIEDNGQGFEKENIAAKDTLGILGMKERSQMMGGNYQISSTPGKGTTVIVSVPYNGKNNLK